MFSMLQPRPDVGKVSLLNTSKELIPLIAIYAYFIGWVYSYFYFSEFGLRLSTLDIPLYYFFVYAFPVLYSKDGLILLIATTLALVILERWKMLSMLVLACLFPLLFHLAHKAGVQGAEAQRLIDTQERIVFTFKGNTKLLSPVLVYNNDNQNLRPLIVTQEAYITFYQPPQEGTVLPGLLVLTIWKSNVATVIHRSAEEILPKEKSK
jgi:hypothetical protein